ncbi:hypothetical protein D1872_335710 [compost metagenome]
MNGALDDGRDAFDHLIARLVTEPVVNIFEVINVDHQATHGFCVTLRQVYLRAQRVFQMVAITQAR